MNRGANFLSWLSAHHSPELAALVQATFANQVLMIPGPSPARPTLPQKIEEAVAAVPSAGFERFISRRAGRAAQSICQVELEFGGVPFVLRCPAAEIAGVERFEVAGFSLARPSALILFWNDKHGQLRKGLAEPVGTPQ